MLVKHHCGHEVNVLLHNALFVRRSLCWKCEEVAKRLWDEQLRKIAEAGDKHDA